VFRAFGDTNRGNVRRTNEDVFYADEELGVLIVADGMGGHAAGEVASRLAVDSVTSFLRRSHNDHEYSWPYGIEATLSLNGNRLRTAVHLANRRVFRAAESHDDYTGMGTTIVCALVADERMIVAHVGDSRLYLLRDGILLQLTRDDSWAATVLGKDAAAPAELRSHPMRNVLTNVLGAREHTDVHLQEYDLRPRDRVLLCSDGVHGSLEHDAIQRALQTDDNTLGATALLQAAMSAGSRDNVTALVGVYEGPPCR
jgi:serine/threonine protein phosphatase PrpC